MPEDVNVRCVEGRLCPVSTINAARRARVQWKKFRKSVLRPRKPPCDLMTMYQPLHCQHTRKQRYADVAEVKRGKTFCFVLRVISRNRALETTYLELQPISILTAKPKSPKVQGIFCQSHSVSLNLNLFRNSSYLNSRSTQSLPLP